jgi:hypothetical protein
MSVRISLPGAAAAAAGKAGPALPSELIASGVTTRYTSLWAPEYGAARRPRPAKHPLFVLHALQR